MVFLMPAARADGAVGDEDAGVAGEGDEGEVVRRGELVDERARGLARGRWTRPPSSRSRRARGARRGAGARRLVGAWIAARCGGGRGRRSGASLPRSRSARRPRALPGARPWGGVASADVADDVALGGGDDAARDGGLEGREVAAAGAVRGGEAAVGVDGPLERLDGRLLLPVCARADRVRADRASVGVEGLVRRAVRAG
jgi:hypothetical protein